MGMRCGTLQNVCGNDYEPRLWDTGDGSVDLHTLLDRVKKEEMRERMNICTNTNVNATIDGTGMCVSYG